MGVLLYLILLFVSGLIVGGLGRLALPGPDPMSIWMTVGIGLAASFIAGLVMWAITGGRYGASFIVSVLVATGLVYLVRRSRGQTAWSTRRPDNRPRRPV
ncbi:GlsB/YeaQ/YmgE family stress response membrane protein [Baekduia soli]|uniref:GlsB/YeaQ/YmgE family stress response membrane protein n=1 Tax=Baekduia soli TaxID=496014 RepID=A0A5B8U0Y3_9ACTN|nr:GlsB/YeaQ/YmgE family stress response membrane protein [Baekduia soli]QEC46647.1 GlsB/YeaQ/YmgE family stress response membrane protein [Baekduia soli]